MNQVRPSWVCVLIAFGSAALLGACSSDDGPLAIDQNPQCFPDTGTAPDLRMNHLYVGRDCPGVSFRNVGGPIDAQLFVGEVVSPELQIGSIGVGSSLVRVTLNGDPWWEATASVADAPCPNVYGSANVRARAFVATTPGTYVFEAIADPAGTIPESREDNNATSRVMLVTHPNLGAWEICFDPNVGWGYPESQQPDTVETGGNLIVEGRFLVWGPLAGPTLVRLERDGVVIRDTTVTGVGVCHIGPGFLTVHAAAWTPTASGSYVYRLVVDPGGTAIESDENDNTATRNLVVVPSGTLRTREVGERLARRPEAACAIPGTGVSF